MRFGTAAVLGLTVIAAHGADYFPLWPGNQWIYRETGVAAGQPVTVEVVRDETFGDQRYWRVEGFPDGPAWLRLSPEGTLFAYNEAEGREEVWAEFGAPEMSPYQTGINECNETAVIVSKAAEYQGPVGQFAHGLRIEYPPGKCADAGIISEYYLPYVGLLERVVNTFAGPRKLELIYARLGGVTYVSEPSVVVSLSLDRLTYPAAESREPAVMAARLMLRNHYLPPFSLEFPSGQQFDLVIRNERSEIVYQWSAGKAFPLVITRLDLGHGEKNFVVETQLVDSGGAPLPPGAYQVEAWLTNMGPRRFSATASFEIVAESRP